MGPKEEREEPMKSYNFIETPLQEEEEKESIGWDILQFQRTRMSAAMWILSRYGSIEHYLLFLKR